MTANGAQHVSLDYSRVALRRHPMSDYATAVRRSYEEAFGREPADGGGWYHEDDWHRICYVHDAMDRGGAVLDVGVGAGQFLNLLGISNRFESVVGIDRITFNKYIELTPSVSVETASVDALPFEDDSFDVVTCMEVLEHVPDEVFSAGLAELRRVCRGQLLMTVPYKEPEPIYKNHLRRFEDPDIVRCFPDGAYTLLSRPRKPWMLIEERFDGVDSRSSVDDAVLRSRIAELEDELERTQNRRALRAANWLGRNARRAKHAVFRRLPPSPGSGRA